MYVRACAGGLCSKIVQPSNTPRFARMPRQQRLFSNVAHMKDLQRHLSLLHASINDSATTTEGRRSGAPSQATNGSEYFENDSRSIILFDGVCNMCNGGVNFMLDMDVKAVYRLAALQSPAGRALLQRSGRRPDDISSIVLVDKDASYIKSEAILRIAKRLVVPFPLLAALGLVTPLGFRDEFYDFVADNRYSVFGKTPSCRLSDSRFADRFVE